MVKEAKGDLWEIGTEADAIVITTNGTVRANGENIMGAGCAREAAQRYPMLPAALGARILRQGNRTHVFFFDSRRPLVAMPTKHSVKERSSLNLIEKGIQELYDYAWYYGWRSVVMPRPGCGLGGLRWQDVKPLVSRLDDRFTVVTFA